MVVVKPIIFSDQSIRAILDGEKVQTRRVIRGENLSVVDRWVEPPSYGSRWYGYHGPAACVARKCPFGMPGGQLWVRENWRIASLPVDECPAIQYRADDAIEWRDPFAMDDALWEEYENWYERMNDQLIEDCERAGLQPNINEEMAYTWTWLSIPTRWRPSIHMPLWASRIALEILRVEVRRLQDISHSGAIAEGAHPWCREQGYEWSSAKPRYWFMRMWNSLNQKRGYGWTINPWVWVLTFKLVRDS